MQSWEYLRNDSKCMWPLTKVSTLPLMHLHRNLDMSESSDYTKYLGTNIEVSQILTIHCSLTLIYMPQK